MEPEVVTKILGSLLEQGPLVGLLFYFYRETKIKSEEQAKRIDELYNELLAKQESYLSKTFETISSNTGALNGLKDVITVKNNG